MYNERVERLAAFVKEVNSLTKDMKTSEQFGVGLFVGLVAGGIGAIVLCAAVMKEESAHQNRIVEETRKAVSKEIQIQLAPIISRIDQWSQAWFLQDP